MCRHVPWRACSPRTSRAGSSFSVPVLETTRATRPATAQAATPQTRASPKRPSRHSRDGSRRRRSVQATRTGDRNDGVRSRPQNTCARCPTPASRSCSQSSTRNGACPRCSAAPGCLRGGRTGGAGASEVLLMNDGSTDATAALLGGDDDLGGLLPVVSTAPNRGKGAAVRRGMLRATGALALMCDVDLSTPLDEPAAAGGGDPRGSRRRDRIPRPRRLGRDRPSAAPPRADGEGLQRPRPRAHRRPRRDTQCGFKSSGWRRPAGSSSCSALRGSHSTSSCSSPPAGWPRGG